MPQPLHLWEKTLVPIELEAVVPQSQYGSFEQHPRSPIQWRSWYTNYAIPGTD